MAELGQSASIKVTIGTLELSASREQMDFSIRLVFADESPQPNFVIDKLTFVRDAYTAIKNYIDEGLTGGAGIFEGIPFRIEVFNINESFIAFDGFIKLNDVEFLEWKDEVIVNIEQFDSLNNIESRLSAFTFQDLLNDSTLIASDFADLPYVIEKNVNLIEQVLLFYMTYNLQKEIREQISSTGQISASIAGISSAALTGSVGALVFAILALAVQLAYLIAMVLIIIDLMIRIKESFLPKKRNHKLISLRKGMEAIATKLGYTFQSELSELDNIHYLASNPNGDTTDKTGLINTVGEITNGIPNPIDYGYGLGEFVALVRQYFYADVAVIGDIMYLNWKGSDFFERQAEVTITDVLEKTKTYNTADVVGNRLLTFRQDLADEWTDTDSEGRIFAVSTAPKVVNNEKARTLEGNETIAFPVALASRKNSLNPLEETLKTLLAFADSVINTLGGNSNLATQITGKVGAMKVSRNSYVVPKLVYLSGGKIPSNHRVLLSSKASYVNYHSWKSFVTNPENAQKELYNNVVIPFGFNDFVKVVGNSYIYATDEQKAKFTEIEWNILKDSATASYFVRSKYTDNLKEEFVE